MPELPGARAPLELSEKADLQSKSIFRSPSTSGKNEELASSDLSEPETTQYPQGLPLFFIVAAISLSIFLASLDMVCPLFRPVFPNIKVELIEDRQ